MAAEWRLLVEKLKRLAVPAGREALGEFALEGYRSMERALRNDAPLLKVLVSETFARSTLQRDRSILDRVAKKEIPLRVSPDEEFHELCGDRRMGEVFGVMAIPAQPSWDSFFQGEGRHLLLVGWNISDPGNTGALIRTALASGASGFLAVGTTDPWHPKAVRTSMGSLFQIPIRRVSVDDPWMQNLQELEVETFASCFDNAETLPEVQPSRSKLALLLGCEAFGLPDQVSAACDRRVSIPMPEGVNSFSVNAAAAILSYTLLQAGKEVETS